MSVNILVRDLYYFAGIKYLCEFFIVALAIVAQMASVGYKIAIERDWIVVIAAQNKGLLASQCL